MAEATGLEHTLILLTARCFTACRKPKCILSMIIQGLPAGDEIDIQGMMWKTTNAGLSWKTYCVSAEPLYDVKALSPTKIIATGGDFEYGMGITVSYDAGSTWETEVTGLFGRGRSVAFRTPNELWVPLDFSQNFGVSPWIPAGLGVHGRK